MCSMPARPKYCIRIYLYNSHATPRHGALWQDLNEDQEREVHLPLVYLVYIVGQIKRIGAAHLHPRALGADSNASTAGVSPGAVHTP